MARIQYQRAAKAGGYRPQQVDERNIARMREETARQVEGMRQAANAEIESRREVARAMKEDAAYTKSAEEKNFQIQTANSNRQIQGLQAQAARDQQQFNINAKETESIFKSISSLSKSASTIATQIQEEQDKERRRKEKKKAQEGKTAADIAVESLASKYELSAISASQINSVNTAVASGSSEYVGEKLKGELNQAVALDITEGEIFQVFDRRYETPLRNRIDTIEKQIGRRLEPDELVIEIDRFRGQTRDRLKLDEFDQEFLRPALERADAVERNFIASRQREFIQSSKNNRRERALGNPLNASPENFNRVLLNSYVEVLDTNNGDRTKTWDDFQQKVFNQTDGKGNFIISIEQIAQYPIYTEPGKAPELFGEKYKNTRFADILSERVKIENQFRSQQIQADNLSSAELEDTLVRAVMENPTVERLEEAKQMYLSTAFKESSKLAVVEKHLTYTAQHKQNIVSAVSKLRDFELTPEIVSAAVAANPTEGAAIKQRYEAYNAKWKSEGYKDATKSLETVVSGTTMFGTTKAAEAGSLPMIGHLKAELRNRTAMYEPTLGFDAAHQKAANELANEYRNGYRDKNSKFFRKVSRNATVSYPNLPVGNVSAAEQTKRDITDLRTSVKTLGVEGVLDTPLSVTSAERLDYIKKNFYKDDFKPTPKEIAFVGMTNGMPLHEAYNRFYKANGDSFRLNSPLRLNGQEVTLTPEDQKILGDPTKGPQAKLAVINRIINPGMFQSASTMRAGSPFLVYTSGNIGPTSTGQHLDVKQVGGGQFPTTALDEYIEVDDPELGVVPLSQVPITGDFASHTARGSHGIDYGLYEGTEIYAKNGARVISNTPTEHGDKLLIQLPNGKQYTFLHGTAAK
jgi:hypothetical protein